MKLKKEIKYLFIAVVVLSGCQANKLSTRLNYPLETGVASWYGPGFHGKKTANGEVFNTNQLTAAHRTLPFGTWVKVVNQQSAESVRVRINDRGPYAKDRIIDLSKAAARKLSMLEHGTARVRLYVDPKAAYLLEIDNLKRPSYTIQIASYANRTKASALAAKHQDGWLKESTASGKKVYRVFVGKFATREKAASRLQQLPAGSGFIKQVEN